MQQELLKEILSALLSQAIYQLYREKHQYDKSSLKRQEIQEDIDYLNGLLNKLKHS